MCAGSRNGSSRTALCWPQSYDAPVSSSRAVNRSCQSSPSAGALRREAQARVRAALAGLRDADRELLVLRHLEELTFQQVAGRMNRSEGGIYKLWVRALGALRRYSSGGS